MIFIVLLGGGVWRTKWNMVDDKSSFLSLSCMQGGSAIAEYNHESSACVIRAKHGDNSNDNHLAYGIDVIKVTSLQTKPADRHVESKVVAYDTKRICRRFTVASCSFYENLVQVWDVQI